MQRIQILFLIDLIDDTHYLFTSLQELCCEIMELSSNVFERCTSTGRELFSLLIDLVADFDAILTSRQTRGKLQCLYENLISNNFRRTAVLKKI